MTRKNSVVKAPFAGILYAFQPKGLVLADHVLYVPKLEEAELQRTESNPSQVDLVPTEDSHLVKVGDRVTAGQVLGYVEALGVFKDLTADVTGQVVTIHAEHGKFVDQSAALFTIELSEEEGSETLISSEVLPPWPGVVEGEPLIVRRD